MAEKITSINKSMLTWARESTVTPIEVMEEKFKNIRKWESGDDYPTYAQLRALSDYYRKPIVVFFFPEPPKMKNIASSFRTFPSAVGSVFNRNIVRLLDWARVMQLNLYELTENRNPSTSKITDIKFDLSSIDKTAQQLRYLMGASLKMQKGINRISDAFEVWRDYFYKIGVFIFKEAFKDNEVSGFCLYDQEFPIICINNSLSMSRQIFTLFHEVYHILCKTSGIDLLNDSIITSLFYDGRDVEMLCNKFASVFLVPDGDFTQILKQIGKLDDTGVDRLAKLYCVSREVIMRKLFDLGSISRDQYEAKRNEYNRDYFRFSEEEKERQKGKTAGNYYRTQLAYKGRHYTELAFNGYYTQKFTVTQLAQYMGMKIPSIQAIAAQRGWGAL